MRMNALHNCKNPFQGSEQKVLAICSAGLLRSPTIAWFLGQHGYNTRSCGIHDYALIQLDEVLLEWADIIIVAHEDIILQKEIISDPSKKYILFDIEDEYAYKEKTLLIRIEEQCIKHGLISNE